VFLRGTRNRMEPIRILADIMGNHAGVIRHLLGSLVTFPRTDEI
jgi:hypothetical protein